MESWRRLFRGRRAPEMWVQRRVRGQGAGGSVGQLGDHRVTRLRVGDDEMNVAVILQLRLDQVHR
jgi:hypothetical protein